MAIRTRFQQTLTRALADAGFQSVAEAARAAGVPYDTLQKAVAGTVIPTPATVRKLARRLELDANRLVRSAIEDHAMGIKTDRESLDLDWKHLMERARTLTPEAERALLERIDWFVRGAEAQTRSTPKRRR